MIDNQDLGFRHQLEDRIRKYSEQRDRVQQQLVELTHTLLTTQRRLDTAIEMFRLEYSEEPDVSIANVAPPTTVEDAPVDGRSSRRMRSGGPSWNEAVAELLREAGEPLHVREMWARMQANGFETESRDPERSLASVLVRHPDVVRTGRNTYGLASVEPGESDRPTNDPDQTQLLAPEQHLQSDKPYLGQEVVA